MGGDGGSIARRQDIVFKKKADAKVDRNLIAYNKWTTCTISQEPLQAPIVACELGNLYNKSALIEMHLLSKHKHHAQAHIRSMKDVIECHPHYIAKDKDSPYFVCPVTSVPGTGKHPFVVMRHCGCVLSERAIKEVPSTSCLNCHKPIPDDDLKNDEWAIPLNPATNAEIDALRRKMDQRRARLRLLKEQNNKSKEKQSAPAADASASSAEAKQAAPAPSAALSTTAPSASDNGSSNIKSESQSQQTIGTKRTATSSGNAATKPQSEDKNKRVATAASKEPPASSHISLSDPRAVARLAAEKLKQQKQDKVFASLFKTDRDLKAEKSETPSIISTKMDSCMGRL